MDALTAHDVSRNSGHGVTAKAVVRTAVDDVPRLVFIIDGDIAVRRSLEVLI